MERVNRTVPIDELRPNPRNSRTHPKKQLDALGENFLAIGGIGSPVVTDENGMLLAGHARVEAAKLVGLREIPVVQLIGLSEAQKRLFLIADNKLAEKAGWDRQKLALELPELRELLIEDGLDISLTGFEAVEIDQLAVDFEEDSSDPADEIPKAGEMLAVTRPGDLWRLGHHRQLCGDARADSDLIDLMGGELAAMGFLDPPYNVRIKGVVGRGTTQHREFRMASGEMSPAKFRAFLKRTLSRAALYSQDGAVHFVCMDWRHVSDLIEVGRQVYGQMLNLVTWVKSNSGQGSFYRSQHELIGVFRVGDGQHLNNVQLGRHGRSRSNVWHYAGVNSFRAGRMDELKVHPTVKPVALVADAIKDCTRRGDVVLDTFSGSGTTILAAERVGRRAYALEIDPAYVDAAIRRWQSFTGKDAIHAESGLTFDERAAQYPAGAIAPRSHGGRAP